MLDHSQKIFQEQIFIKHYAPFLKLTLMALACGKFKKRFTSLPACSPQHGSALICCQQAAGERSALLSWPCSEFLSGLHETQYLEPGKEKFKQATFMFHRLNNWITTLPLYRLFSSFLLRPGCFIKKYQIPQTQQTNYSRPHCNLSLIGTLNVRFPYRTKSWLTR